MTVAPTTITPFQIESFLALQGWEKIAEGTSGGTWRLPGHEEAPDLLVPTEVDADFARAVESVLSRLSWVTRLREIELVDAIMESTSDALEVLVKDPTTTAGRISLRRGMLLAQSLFEVVQNGVRVAFLGGRPSYYGSLPDDAARVLDDMMLVPPRAGSFRLVMLSPVTEVLDFDPDLLPVDPHRRALAAALSALDATRVAAESAMAEPADLEAAVEQGMSSTLLRAIAALDTQSTALQVEFRGRFASTELPDVPRTVRFEPRHFSRMEPMRDMVRQLQPKDGFVLEGWIKNVGVEEPVMERTLAGTVVVETRIEGRTREVHVELSEDTFQDAASGIGRTALRARGRLEKIGKYWHLVEPENVRITRLAP
jgi:hypothetical protein